MTAVAGDRQVALFNVDGTLYALDNECRHAQGPLGEGTVRSGIVTCPWHWWRYELATGRRLGSDTVVQPTYEATVVDGTVMVEVPEPQQPMSIREQLLQHAHEWSRDR